MIRLQIKKYRGQYEDMKKKFMQTESGFLEKLQKKELFGPRLGNSQVS